MSQIKIGKFTSDGGLVYLPIGFEPNWVEVVARGASSTNALVYKWNSLLAELSTVIDGWAFAAAGTNAEIASASGISTYDSASEGPTISTWTQTVGSAATARSATAHGTYVRPSTSSSTDRSAIFECVTDGDSAATEPTWPAAVGEQVTDGTTVWERVNVATKRVGYKGIKLAASMTGLADSNEGYYIAIEGDDVVDHGDVDGWTGGIEGS